MKHIVQLFLLFGCLAVGNADQLLFWLPELLEGIEGMLGIADRAGVQNNAASGKGLAEILRIVRFGIFR